MDRRGPKIALVSSFQTGQTMRGNKLDDMRSRSELRGEESLISFLSCARESACSLRKVLPASASISCSGMGMMIL